MPFLKKIQIFQQRSSRFFSYYKSTFLRSCLVYFISQILTFVFLKFWAWLSVGEQLIGPKLFHRKAIPVYHIFQAFMSLFWWKIPGTGLKQIAVQNLNHFHLQNGSPANYWKSDILTEELVALKVKHQFNPLKLYLQPRIKSRSLLILFNLR